MGVNWVDPPKRERKRIVNYSETEFRVWEFGEVLLLGGVVL